MDDEYDVVGGYVPSFVRHLEDTRARLGLGPQTTTITSPEPEADPDSDSDSNSEQVLVDTSALPYATHTPTRALSGWTRAERDAFFRALSVHSRWRPDLVAECVPTRGEWEVWMALEALEEGAVAVGLGARGGGEGEDVDVDADVDGSSTGSWSHSESGSDADADADMDVDEEGDEELCEPAIEVSQAWVDVEERMATWIVHQEHLESIEDAEDAPPGRKQKRGRECRARGQTASHEGSRSPSPSSSQFPSPSVGSPSRSRSRKRERLMSQLKVPHLLVLDSILREGEERTKGSKSREGSVMAVTPVEHGDEEARSGDVLASGSSCEVTRSPSDTVTDPVLLALSRGTELAEPDPGPAQGTSNVDSQTTPLEVSSQTGVGDMSTSQLGDAAPNPDATVNVDSDLSLLSPRSRRRIQKRLYMRRKRAQLRENDGASEGAVYTGIERLKPGKKAKAKSEEKETPIASAAVPCFVPSDAETKVPRKAPKKNKPGLTLPYRLRAQFAELGVDAAYLLNEDMDLLNLGALGRLMRLCSPPEQGKEEGDESAMLESIDAQLIRHLQVAMVMFVTDVIHRAIVWRERDVRLKQRSRAWRHGDQITIAAIEHAVEAIGARYHSHKAYFKSLEALHADPMDVSAVEPEPRGVSAHRDVYAPLVHAPSAWQMTPLACLSRTYEREATRTRRGASADMDEDALMSDETDEEALEAELQGEDAVDVVDSARAGREEGRLWSEIRYS